MGVELGCINLFDLKVDTVMLENQAGVKILDQHVRDFNTVFYRQGQKRFGKIKKEISTYGRTNWNSIHNDNCYPSADEKSVTEFT